MAGGHNNHNHNGRPPTVLNVAEKPSVARALAGVLAGMQGTQDRGMRREGAQIFTHENVQFPSVFSQGEGRMIHGPSTYLQSIRSVELSCCGLVLFIFVTESVASSLWRITTLNSALLAYFSTRDLRYSMRLVLMNVLHSSLFSYTCQLYYLSHFVQTHPTR
jgi:hypothetical protein